MGHSRDLMSAMRLCHCLLAEGSVLERVRRSQPDLLDEHILHAAMLCTEAGRSALRKIYKEYLAIGASFDLPMIVLTPTWRASRSRLRAAGFSDDCDVNRDAVLFLRDVCAEYGSYSSEVFVGGLLACANDAYRPEETLTRCQAEEYHAPQAAALAEAGVDFLLAATLPA